MMNPGAYMMALLAVINSKRAAEGQKVLEQQNISWGIRLGSPGWSAKKRWKRARRVRS